ncbi:twitching motility protein PilT [Bathymodiolus thermophilus thioautotrophic gill symbiont]|uniref:Twitching motility protein PilT n=1 Tax=Bathymodiolus thermophilus thioautotrophic gill symbiont TaxID=2360 RepID=A0A3G3IJB0_9GAMM|nr:PIN domain-containing protein [Bathymodiolus thermophilus thioautotrophic gill symbiont]AYQ55925.1 twitching motility protein PilT [Bathymodiolus thermophilus thioautotrophic gill symbiont]
MICLDTNVLIKITKNNIQVIEKLARLNTALYVLFISAMELIIGARNNKEKTKLMAFINQFNLIYMDKNASHLANKLVVKYAKSHHLDIPDALIAASCIEGKFTPWTYNSKDFHYLPGLVLL